MTTDELAVYVWPDDDWCFEDELPEMEWKSDDFLKVPSSIFFPSESYDESVASLLNRTKE